MPTTQMCATCVTRKCNRTAVLFKRCPPRPEFHQARTEAQGPYCEPAAWRHIFHAMRTRPDVIGGEVRPIHCAV